MKKNVQMPRLSENMDVGVLVAWNKEAGEAIKKGEILFEVETEKVISEVESLESGIIAEIFYEEGDQIGVNDVIAVIDCIE